jgi:outer membrane protein assembly factor BamE (lipoprotein component of BamABCDE complex)
MEIVEGRLQAGPQEQVRREDVIELLGTDNIEWDYPNSRRDGFLVWWSRRSLEQGSHLVVYFDKRGIVQSYDWVSE